MNFFDFLSSSPNLFILQKRIAKTNFGGILFCFYIIIMLSISLAYIINYAINEKYTFEVKKIDNTTNNEIPLGTPKKGRPYKPKSPYKEFDKDELLNPLLNITIIAGGKFRIFDNKIQNYLEGYNQQKKSAGGLYNITRRVSELDLEYHYICGNDSNCSSIDNESSDYLERDLIFYYIGYKLDHQAEIPFQIERDKLYVYPQIFGLRDLDKGNIIEFDWEVIQYKDKQTIFDSLINNKKETITFGHLKPEYKMTYFDIAPKEKHIKCKEKFKDKIYYINFLSISFKNKHYEYILYERTKKEFLDILASIGALFSTLKFFFDLIFSFYSRNFNNYKILEKILNSPDHFKKIEIDSEFKDSINQSVDEENNNQMKDIDNKDLLIDKSSSENESESEKEINIKKIDINNKNTDEANETNEADETNPIALDKLPFIDFFYNNIYCKCCKKRRNQELINSINEISYKYLSIDALLINQLKLEKLFKDYNWNNPSLNNILNNTMIKKLKNI